MMGRISKAKAMLWMPLAVAFAMACGDQPVETATADLGAVARMDVVAGNTQTGEVGTQLSNPLVVRVSDALGRPVQNQIVNFRVVAGGGSVFAGASITDAEGRAQEWWTLGGEAGENVVEARAVHTASGEKVVFARFTATGVNGDEGPATPEQPEEEKPAEEKPEEEKPAEEKPVEEKPEEDRPVEERPVEEKPVEEKPVEEAPSTAWTRGTWQIGGGGVSVMLDLDRRTITLPQIGTLNVTRTVSGNRLNISFTVPGQGAASMALQHQSNELRGTAKMGNVTENVVGRRPSPSGGAPEPSAPEPQQPRPEEPQSPPPPTSGPQQPPAPGQNGNRRNEPTGFTRIGERPFEAMHEGGWNDGAAPASSGVRAQFDIVNDPTAPQGSRVGRVTLPTGLNEGSSSRMIRSGINIGTPKQMYMAFWLKVSDNWYNHDGAAMSKIFYLGHPLFLALHGSGNSAMHFQFALQGGEAYNARWNSADNRVSPTSAQAQLVRGEWKYIEILVELNDPGVYNGRLHAWMDGVKTHEFHNRRILAAGSGQYSQIGFVDYHPIYGGQNGRNVPATQYQYIDHLYLSHRP